MIDNSWSPNLSAKLYTTLLSCHFELLLIKHCPNGDIWWQWVSALSFLSCFYQNNWTFASEGPIDADNSSQLLQSDPVQSSQSSPSSPVCCFSSPTPVIFPYSGRDSVPTLLQSYPIIPLLFLFISLINTVLIVLGCSYYYSLLIYCIILIQLGNSLLERVWVEYLHGVLEMMMWWGKFLLTKGIGGRLTIPLLNIRLTCYKRCLI